MKVRAISFLLIAVFGLITITGCDKSKEKNNEGGVDPLVSQVIESYCKHIHECGSQLSSCPIATSTSHCYNNEMYIVSRSRAMLSCQVDVGIYYQCMSKVPCGKLGDFFNTTMRECDSNDKTCVLKAFEKNTNCKQAYLDKQNCLDSYNGAN